MPKLERPNDEEPRRGWSQYTQVENSFQFQYDRLRSSLVGGIGRGVANAGLRE